MLFLKKNVEISRTPTGPNDILEEQDVLLSKHAGIRILLLAP